jgi:opacity protein-like surface antigen
MKRTLLAVVPTLCVAAPAMAGDRDSHGNFTGFYTGIGAGVSQSFDHLDSMTQSTFNTLFTATTGKYQTQHLNTSQNQLLGHNFAAGTVYLGFGKQFEDSRVYLGGEVFAEAAQNVLTTSSTAARKDAFLFRGVPTGFNNSDSETLVTETRVKFNPIEFGVDLKPGIVVNPTTLFYGRIGVSFNRIDASSNSKLTINIFNPSGSPAGSSTSSLNLHHTKNVTGLRLGLGMEEILGNRFAGTVDYIYTYYSNGPTLSGAANVFSPGVITTTNGLTNNTTIKAYNQTFMVGLKYYFC